MSNFEHAKYDADGVRIDDPSFNTQALREDTSLVNGITFPGTNTVAINTNSVERLRVGDEGQTTILAASSSPALKVIQTGAGNAFVVEDSASTDATPFVIDGNGTAVFGHTSQLAGSVYNPTRQMVGTDSGAGLGVFEYSADTSRPIIQLNKSRGAAVNTHTVVASGDPVGQIQFSGSDGAGFIRAALISAEVDGTPGTNDMPGRLVFSTTADGASSPTEALRIDSTQSVTNLAAGSGTNAYGFRVTSAKIGGTNNYAFSGEIAAGANRYNLYMSGTADNYIAGNLGIGAVPATSTKLLIGGAFNAAAVSFALRVNGAVDPSVVSSEFGVFASVPTVSAGTLPDLEHFVASQGAYAGTVNRQYGFYVAASLTGAATNYGFHSNLAASANRWNFYAAGTAANYFAGDIQLGKTVTAGGVTGAQTINKTTGSVNFAAAATSLVVTNSLVTTSSVIVATVATNDATMKSVAAVAAAGSFTLHANAAATAETRVNFCVFN